MKELQKGIEDKIELLIDDYMKNQKEEEIIKKQKWWRKNEARNWRKIKIKW